MSGRLGGLQALRGVAALLVVVYHGLIAVHDNGLGSSFLVSIGQFAKFGAVGVDIFFVISGFIMVYTTRNGVMVGEFLTKRLVRVLPMYWLLTTAWVCLKAATPAASQATTLSLEYVVASYLLIPHANSLGDMFPVLYPGWTLTFELLFYGAFGATLAIRQNWRVPVLFAGFSLLVLLGKIGVFEAPALLWISDSIVYEFIFGCVVARLFIAGPALPREAAWALLALSVTLFSVSIATDLSWMPRALRWGVPSALLVYGCAAFATAPAALIRLGDASYSLYLIHPMILPVMGKAWKLTGIQWADGFVLAYAVACAVAALLTHRMLEQPLSRALSAMLRPRSKLVAGQ